MEHFDVLVIGAGLSGVAAGYHLQKNCPDRTFTILEQREQIGGTWDLFRYPGVRSDSDMHTFGYSFEPWTGSTTLANGSSILNYVRETSKTHGIDEKIRFGHAVRRAAWSSTDALWTVEIKRSGETEFSRLTCAFLYMCSGYYNYEAGYNPEFSGTNKFKGTIVHPQHWPENLVYKDKRVIIIGSGATAVTLLPEIAKTASHVTLLQRSPTYIASVPQQTRFAKWMHILLWRKLAFTLMRWGNVLHGAYIYAFCRRFPNYSKSVLLGLVRDSLGPDYDIDKHFTPSYGPWQQRLCLVPDGDFFDAIKEGQASVITDHIDTFTEDGLRLRSGRELEAELIVTATGLAMLFLGGLEVIVDGVKKDFSQALTYKGAMFSNVPNLALATGYTNASWTLKSELISKFVCRLLNHMMANGYDQCSPRHASQNDQTEMLLDFTSGYVERSIDSFPKQCAKAPWKLHQNYIRDVWSLSFGSLVDETLEFTQRAGVIDQQASGARLGPAAPKYVASVTR